MKYLYWDLVLNNPKRIEIYLSGCKAPHCEGCHNPESWDFDSGKNISDNLIQQFYKYKDLYENIWILGGEPLDQAKDDLIWLLYKLKSFDKKIWVWTRYNFDEIDKDILRYCDYVKTGKFINDGSSYIAEYGIKLASSNQEIIKLKQGEKQ